tara:strand:+ start:648211 stop:648852 length:642 start_codon:yes stop_codon:yes gene_type:complete
MKAEQSKRFLIGSFTVSHLVLSCLAVTLWLSQPGLSHAKGEDTVAKDEDTGGKDKAGTKAKPGSQEHARKGPVERTRRMVRMLDDIYKGGIVAITDNYVNDTDAIPAGTAFKQVFQTAEQKGWHRVRLVDGLGEPINEENSPEDAFEKKALKALVAGESTWVEKIERDGDKRMLRVATPVPVVFEKCIMCHDNYEGVPAGQAIGALTYSIEIQ